MIAYIEGKVFFSGKGNLIVKTRSGLGYEIRVPLPAYSSFQTNDEISLYTHTHVREDELTLYGFLSMDEKEWFELLIKTTGVGPKLGLSVLSLLPVNQLQEAVIHDNIEAFSRVPGIGRKTAAKLCLDLKDHIKNHRLKQVSGNGVDNNNAGENLVINQDQELASALKNMGYQDREINSVIYKIGSFENSFEDRLKKALSLLAPLS